MALGTNYARSSRKTHLIVYLASIRGVVPDKTEIRRLRRMKVDELAELVRQEKSKKESQT